MRRLLFITACFIAICMGACSSGSKSQQPDKADFVTVRDGEFYIGDSIYRFVGTNFWYGALLASEGYGDRQRLSKELDKLQETGINNLRILVGGDGKPAPSHIEPILQSEPGVYNDTLLAGLDYLLNELEQRGMKAVLYLNNAWEWSGGYGAYLEWTGHGKAPIPGVDGYQAYVNYVKQFVLSDSAKALALNHVRNIVGRTNSITGKPYAESPAIMAWQVANEPRAFSAEGKKALADWIRTTARTIKEIDTNHLVSTGSEGKYGCESDLDLWTEIHSYPEIDYANIHIWPYNWNWITPQTVVEDGDNACAMTLAYINEHFERISPQGKPLVLEEFGYPRDSMAIAPGLPTKGRDRYYEYVFSIIRDSGKINGSNFWGWGGYANPQHRTWQKGDDYSGDPAQEDQGLNSVFATDSGTIEIIKNFSRDLKSINR